MKGTGDTPSQVAPSLATTLDATDLYLSDRMDNIQGGVVVNAAAVFPAPVVAFVPAGEIWFGYSVHALGAAGVTAGATVKAQLAIYRASLGQYQLLNAQGAFLAGEVVSLGFNFEQPVLMRPGDRAALNVFAITGAPNFTVNLYVFAARVQI